MWGYAKRIVVLAAVVLCGPAGASGQLSFELVGRYQTGVFDDGAAEIVAYDKKAHNLFVINANTATVDVLSITDPTTPTLLTALEVSDIGSGVNSVAVYKNWVAIAVQANNKQDPGFVAFYDAKTFKRLNVVTVGALPDMLTFTRNGRYVVVANEGEPNDDYTVDPEGSISIINLRKGVKKATVATAGFTAFNGQEAALAAQNIRIFGPGATVAQDLEPEYVAVSSDSKTAWVTLQENNAIAKVDIPTATVTALLPLGVKDHSQLPNALDASNRDDAIAIQTWPVSGYYMPDAIDAFKRKGQTYLVLANEGDSRDYDGFSEEARVKDLVLDETVFPDAEALQEDEALGRLNITVTAGDVDGDGDFDALYSYGARSFSIRDANGKLVFDSGSEFETLLAQLAPENFNSTNDENDSFDNRSDDKGPEPEAIEVAKIRGVRYAFIGLERMGGVMVYNITRPEEARFVTYLNSRNFDVPVTLDDGTTNPEVGDLGPEGLLFIAKKDSPIGVPLLVSASEISGTTSVFKILLD